MRLCSRVLGTIEAATKVSLLDLVDGAVKGGWSPRDACRYLEVSPRQVERWRSRPAFGVSLVNLAPGGNPVHGINPAEETEIVAVFDEWADIYLAHCKLAQRGSWLGGLG